MPNNHLCQCGCGLPCKRYYDPSGTFKCYGKYAENCPRPRTKYNELPVGTRRLYRRKNCPDYWQLKVAPGHWELEHRVIMSKLLNRPLLSSEIVHHKDEDGLHNEPDNLELLSGNAEHRRRHGEMNRARWWCKKHQLQYCVACGRSEHPHLSRGLCRPCYKKREWLTYEKQRRALRKHRNDLHAEQD